MCMYSIVIRKSLNLWPPILFERKLVVNLYPIVYFDDISGNRTKKWNCFNAWSILLAGLPKSVNAQLQNIHLLSISNKVSPLDMLEPIVEDLVVLQNGVDMFECTIVL